MVSLTRVGLSSSTSVFTAASLPGRLRGTSAVVGCETSRRCGSARRAARGSAAKSRAATASGRPRFPRRTACGPRRDGRIGVFHPLRVPITGQRLRPERVTIAARRWSSRGRCVASAAWARSLGRGDTPPARPDQRDRAGVPGRRRAAPDEVGPAAARPACCWPSWPRRWSPWPWPASAPGASRGRGTGGWRTSRMPPIEISGQIGAARADADAKVIRASISPALGHDRLPDAQRPVVRPAGAAQAPGQEPGARPPGRRPGRGHRVTQG